MFSKSNLKRVFLCECHTTRTERLLFNKASLEWAACRLAVLFREKGRQIEETESRQTKNRICQKQNKPKDRQAEVGKLTEKC